MARETDGSARGKSRRASVGVDPGRSSLRRTSTRRSVVPRPSVAPRPELKTPLTTPRNRRVSRAPGRVGLGLAAWSVEQVRALARGCVDVARALAAGLGRLFARLRGPSSALLKVLCAVGFVAGAWALGRFVHRHLTTAPAFAIDAVEVQGLARLDREELLEAAGLTLGQNVFTRSPEEVEARLLRHPWVVAAEVQRKLPSRFEIVVHERKPIALLVLDACQRIGSELRDEVDDPNCDEPSSLYLVSDDARMFKRLSGKDPVDLPVITGVSRPRLASDPELSHRILSESVALMAAYGSSGLAERSPIEEIHVEPNDGYSLYVGEDLTYVRLGVPPFDQKLLRMKRVFERLSREHARAEYVYLDNEQRPDRVAVRLR